MLVLESCTKEKILGNYIIYPLMRCKQVGGKA